MEWDCSRSPFFSWLRGKTTASVEGVSAAVSLTLKVVILSTRVRIDSCWSWNSSVLIELLDLASECIDAEKLE